MGNLILLNDVLTGHDGLGLIIGDADLPASPEGQKQADVIVDYLYSKIPHVDYVFSSDAVRIKKLVHKIRVKSKNQNLTGIMCCRVELRERSFGVLNKTPLLLSNDIFKNTRLKVDEGESIFECRIRAMTVINEI